MIDKFRFALSGLVWAVRTQSSFHVHLPVAMMVVVLAATMRLNAWQWSMLILAIGGVLTAELLNTAIEVLVQVLHPQRDPVIGRGLDVAAAGVLVASITAALIGVVVFVPELCRVWFADAP